MCSEYVLFGREQKKNATNHKYVQRQPVEDKPDLVNVMLRSKESHTGLQLDDLALFTTSDPDMDGTRKYTQHIAKHKYTILSHIQCTVYITVTKATFYCLALEVLDL